MDLSRCATVTGCTGWGVMRSLNLYGQRLAQEMVPGSPADRGGRIRPNLLRCHEDLS